VREQRDETTRMLLEPEAAELLAAFSIPYVVHGVAGDVDAAVALATEIGYPVVLKVVSEDVVHKTEVGGVVTDVRGEDVLRTGYAAMLESVRAQCPDADIRGVLVARHIEGRELIVGAIRDVTFGATVMVGLGGVFTEVLADVAFRLAPITLDDGLEMLGELRGVSLLTGARGGRSVDLAMVAELIVNAGELLLARPGIREIDLNPLAVTQNQCIALDARVIVDALSGEGGVGVTPP
jgi:succinyl-CoA synthetase beta subunit